MLTSYMIHVPSLHVVSIALITNIFPVLQADSRLAVCRCDGGLDYRAGRYCWRDLGGVCLRDFLRQRCRAPVGHLHHCIPLYQLDHHPVHAGTYFKLWMLTIALFNNVFFAISQKGGRNDVCQRIHGQEPFLRRRVHSRRRRTAHRLLWPAGSYHRYRPLQPTA